MGTMHELGWVHRDVSTGNILLYREEGEVRVILADLEYAKKMGLSGPERSDVRTVSCISFRLTNTQDTYQTTFDREQQTSWLWRLPN